MKWMKHDRKKKELLFKLEEHELVDEMDYHLYFDGPRPNELNIGRVQLSCGPEKAKSDWTLKYSIPETLLLHLGEWTFVVIGLDKIKGDYIVASGFSRGMHFVCHQVVTIRI